MVFGVIIQIETMFKVDEDDLSDLTEVQRFPKDICLR